MPGVVRGVDVDSNLFIGNFAERCSLEGLHRPGRPSVAALVGPRAAWSPLLPPSKLQGGSQNLFPIESDRPWTHVRLSIYPDGGVARLRVYGEVSVDVATLARSKRRVDPAPVPNGGPGPGARDLH